MRIIPFLPLGHVSRHLISSLTCLQPYLNSYNMVAIIFKLDFFLFPSRNKILRLHLPFLPNQSKFFYKSVSFMPNGFRNLANNLGCLLSMRRFKIMAESSNRTYTMRHNLNIDNPQRHVQASTRQNSMTIIIGHLC
jgi:hypothetical protein